MVLVGLSPTGSCAPLPPLSPPPSRPPKTKQRLRQVYETGSRNLEGFIERGWLEQDETPCFYIYSQRMGDHVQTGVVAGVAVEDYALGIIKRYASRTPPPLRSWAWRVWSIRSWESECSGSVVPGFGRRRLGVHGGLAPASPVVCWRRSSRRRPLLVALPCQVSGSPAPVAAPAESRSFVHFVPRQVCALGTPWGHLAAPERGNPSSYSSGKRRHLCVHC